MEPSGLLSHPVRLAGTSLLRLQSDDRLVELVRAGHEPAFDTIVHRYRPVLLRYCTRVLGPERGEDAVQQALASAHTAMTNGDERDLQLRPWLYRIAHNTALNLLRGGRREEVELSDGALAAAHTPEDQVAQREQLESVLAAIAALPRSQRDALLLRELEGRSHEEIGRALGVSSGAARATLFRARAAVRTACSALTPTPLLLRVAEIGAADGGSSHVAAKAVAGVLAGCALVGGGATSGVIGGTHHPVAPAASRAATQRVAQAHTTATAAPSSTTTLPAAPDGAPTTSAPVAALQALAAPKPVKAEKAKPPKAGKAKPPKAESSKPPTPAMPTHGPTPSPAPAAPSGRHRGHVGHADHRSGDPGATHGGRGGRNGDEKHGDARAPVAPAAAPSGHGHADGHAKHDDQAIEGVSGRRAKADSMSASENSGSSRRPDK